jgi:membrane-associated phospholipid phosphatase
MNMAADEGDDDTRELNSSIWILVATMALLVAISFAALGMGIDIPSNWPLIEISLSYWLIAYCCCRLRRNSLISDALVLFGQLFIVTGLGLLLTYAASAIPLPYRDAEFHAFDLWLGFDRVAWHEFLDSHPLVLEILNAAYYSMAPQSFVVPLVLIAARQMPRLQEYAMAYGLALIATALIASFVPAMNAFVYVDLPARGLTEPPAGTYSYFPTLEALRHGSLRNLPLYGFEGLVSFPSFHTANAILYAWATWKLRIGRWLFLLLNGLMIVSTPIDGGHYILDLFGGGAVALGAIAATHRMFRRQSPGVSGIAARHLALAENN